MATASPAGSGGGSRRRVLLFPVPFQGHLTPMLQLAGALHARGGGGLGVTVFYAAFNAPDPARHPAGFRFVPVRQLCRLGRSSVKPLSQKSLATYSLSYQETIL